MPSVGKDDLCSGLEGFREAFLVGGLNGLARVLDTHTHHSDDHCAEDGNEADDGHIADPLKGPGKCAEPGDDHAHHAKDNGAGAVVRDRVHHDGKSQHMAAHDEDEEKHLRSAEDLPSPLAQHHFAGIGHVMHMWVSEFELAQNEASVRCEDTKTGDEDHTTREWRQRRARQPLLVGNGLRNEANLCED